MSIPPPLVRLRCGAKGCRSILAEFHNPPADWSGRVRIMPCKRHGGIRGHIFDEARRRFAKGLDPKPVLVLKELKWRDLRPLFSEAATRGRTIEEVIMP